MKKEYLILVALILLLSGYLLFHKDNSEQVDLPEIPEIKTDRITSFQIRQSEETIVLVKKDKQWFIQGIDRLADSIAVENMIDTLKKFKLSALISQKQDLKRYDLDGEKKISVVASSDNSPVFEFSLGKTAPTMNHTFVMLKNDKNIYHANGSFRTHFEKDTAGLRDKKVFEFKEKSIREFSLEKEGVVKTFTGREEKKEGKDPVISWVSDKGPAPEREKISALLGSLAFLECDSFLDPDQKEKLKDQTPICRISLKNENRMEMAFYPSDAQDEAAGTTTMSEDAFLLSKFKNDEIMGIVDQLLGIEKEETEETN